MSVSRSQQGFQKMRSFVDGSHRSRSRYNLTGRYPFTRRVPAYSGTTDPAGITSPVAAPVRTFGIGSPCPAASPITSYGKLFPRERG